MCKKCKGKGYYKGCFKMNKDEIDSYTIYCVDCKNLWNNPHLFINSISC